MKCVQWTSLILWLVVLSGHVVRSTVTLQDCYCSFLADLYQLQSNEEYCNILETREFCILRVTGYVPSAAEIQGLQQSFDALKDQFELQCTVDYTQIAEDAINGTDALEPREDTPLRTCFCDYSAAASWAVTYEQYCGAVEGLLRCLVEISGPDPQESDLQRIERQYNDILQQAQINCGVNPRDLINDALNITTTTASTATTESPTTATTPSILAIETSTSSTTPEDASTTSSTTSTASDVTDAVETATSPSTATTVTTEAQGSTSTTTGSITSVEQGSTSTSTGSTTSAGQGSTTISGDNASTTPVTNNNPQSSTSASTPNQGGSTAGSQGGSNSAPTTVADIVILQALALASFAGLLM